jgi:hypothetical protein
MQIKRGIIQASQRQQRLAHTTAGTRGLCKRVSAAQRGQCRTPLTAGLTSGSSNIPSGALGVVYQALFSSATAGASLTLAPHGASNPNAYASIGNLAAANATLAGGGLLSVDTNGQITIQASGGTCSVTLYTYGYVI